MARLVLMNMQTLQMWVVVNQDSKVMESPFLQVYMIQFYIQNSIHVSSFKTFELVQHETLEIYLV